MNTPLARDLAVTGAIIAAVLLACPHKAGAETYPSRPIKLLVGASAGGTTDTIARAIAREMSPALGQSVIVENRAGAGGNLAADAVAKSSPDGYTLLVSFTSHTINATLYPKLPYDPAADFMAITMIATVPSMLVSHPKLPANDLKSLIALAKSKPNALSIAIGGIGSSLHLAGERFKMMAGIQLTNVPYKGTAPALTDVLGAQVDTMFISLVTGTTQVQAGRLRAYGVTSAERQPSLPNLPAIGEVLTGFESTAWFGLFGPANLPPAVTERLNSTLAAALKKPQLREPLTNEGATPIGNSSADFTKFVREDIKRWAPIVRQSGAAPD